LCYDLLRFSPRFEICFKSQLPFINHPNNISLQIFPKIIYNQPFRNASFFQLGPFLHVIFLNNDFYIASQPFTSTSLTKPMTTSDYFKTPCSQTLGSLLPIPFPPKTTNLSLYPTFSFNSLFFLPAYMYHTPISHRKITHIPISTLSHSLYPSFHLFTTHPNKQFQSPLYNPFHFHTQQELTITHSVTV
jgi:hypothetical protein